MKNNPKITWNILLILIPIVCIFYIIDIKDVFGFEIFITLIWLLGSFLIIGLLLTAIIISDIEKVFPSKIKLITVGLLLFTYIFVQISFNGGFWGKTLISAEFIDDRSSIRLKLFENGKYILVSDRFFGDERFVGNYKMNSDTIFFENSPLIDNDFVSKEIIIKDDLSYFYLLPSGEYDKDYYYFKIK
ncbi:hypothetical protein [Aureivirga sp. CE67]|uniref:hypothetical protein n=1 Tax=Aureivirga sp. CE67 TaxID=1788983 RepID=UPI0018CB7D2B|nr:hypothetical protein [Aureivirga sp. CE67]